MSDRNIVACDEDHELDYILRKYGKRQTKDNREELRSACKAHKKDKSYKPANRESFYKYIADKKVLKKLENLK